MEEKKEFSNLKKIRLEILQEKLNEGLYQFEKNPNKQWIPLKLEKPLVKELSEIVEQLIEANRWKEIDDLIRNTHNK